MSLNLHNNSFIRLHGGNDDRQSTNLRGVEGEGKRNGECGAEHGEGNVGAALVANHSFVREKEREEKEEQRRRRHRHRKSANALSSNRTPKVNHATRRKSASDVDLNISKSGGSGDFGHDLSSHHRFYSDPSVASSSSFASSASDEDNQNAPSPPHGQDEERRQQNILSALRPSSSNGHGVDDDDDKREDDDHAHKQEATPFHNNKEQADEKPAVNKNLNQDHHRTTSAAATSSSSSASPLRSGGEKTRITRQKTIKGESNNKTNTNTGKTRNNNATNNNNNMTHKTNTTSPRSVVWMADAADNNNDHNGEEEGEIVISEEMRTTQSHTEETAAHKLKEALNSEKEHTHDDDPASFSPTSVAGRPERGEGVRQLSPRVPAVTSALPTSISNAAGSASAANATAAINDFSELPPLIAVSSPLPPSSPSTASHQAVIKNKTFQNNTTACQDEVFSVKMMAATTTMRLIDLDSVAKAYNRAINHRYDEHDDTNNNENDCSGVGSSSGGDNNNNKASNPQRKGKGKAQQHHDGNTNAEKKPFDDDGSDTEMFGENEREVFVEDGGSKKMKTRVVTQKLNDNYNNKSNNDRKNKILCAIRDFFYSIPTIFTTLAFVAITIVGAVTAITAEKFYKEAIETHQKEVIHGIITTQQKRVATALLPLRTAVDEIVRSGLHENRMLPTEEEAARLRFQQNAANGGSSENADADEDDYSFDATASAPWQRHYSAAILKALRHIGYADGARVQIQFLDGSSLSFYNGSESVAAGASSSSSSGDENNTTNNNSFSSNQDASPPPAFVFSFPRMVNMSTLISSGPSTSSWESLVPPRRRRRDDAASLTTTTNTTREDLLAAAAAALVEAEATATVENASTTTATSNDSLLATSNDWLPTTTTVEVRQQPQQDPPQTDNFLADFIAIAREVSYQRISPLRRSSSSSSTSQKGFAQQQGVTLRGRLETLPIDLTTLEFVSDDLAVHVVGVEQQRRKGVEDLSSSSSAAAAVSSGALLRPIDVFDNNNNNSTEEDSNNDTATVFNGEGNATVNRTTSDDAEGGEETLATADIESTTITTTIPSTSPSMPQKSTSSFPPATTTRPQTTTAPTSVPSISSTATTSAPPTTTTTASPSLPVAPFMPTFVVVDSPTPPDPTSTTSASGGSTTDAIPPLSVEGPDFRTSAWFTAAPQINDKVPLTMVRFERVMLRTVSSSSSGSSSAATSSASYSSPSSFARRTTTEAEAQALLTPSSPPKLMLRFTGWIHNSTHRLGVVCIEAPAVDLTVPLTTTTTAVTPSSSSASATTTTAATANSIVVESGSLILAAPFYNHLAAAASTTTTKSPTAPISSLRQHSPAASSFLVADGDIVLSTRQAKIVPLKTTASTASTSATTTTAVGGSGSENGYFFNGGYYSCEAVDSHYILGGEGGAEGSSSKESRACTLVDSQKAFSASAAGTLAAPTNNVSSLLKCCLNQPEQIGFTPLLLLSKETPSLFENSPVSTGVNQNAIVHDTIFSQYLMSLESSSTAESLSATPTEADPEIGTVLVDGGGGDGTNEDESNKQGTYLVAKATVPMPLTFNQKWTIVTFIHTDDFNADFSHARSLIIGVTAAVSAVTAILFVFISQFFVLRPLTIIARQMRRGVFAQLSSSSSSLSSEEKMDDDEDDENEQIKMEGKKNVKGTKKSNQKQKGDVLKQLRSKPSKLTEIRSVQIAYWALCDAIGVLKAYVPEQIQNSSGAELKGEDREGRGETLGLQRKANFAANGKNNTINCNNEVDDDVAALLLLDGSGSRHPASNMASFSLDEILVGSGGGEEKGSGGIGEKKDGRFSNNNILNTNQQVNTTSTRSRLVAKAALLSSQRQSEEVTGDGDDKRKKPLNASSNQQRQQEEGEQKEDDGHFNNEQHHQKSSSIRAIVDAMEEEDDEEDVDARVGKKKNNAVSKRRGGEGGTHPTVTIDAPSSFSDQDNNFRDARQQQQEEAHSPYFGFNFNVRQRGQQQQQQKNFISFNRRNSSPLLAIRRRQQGSNNNGSNSSNTYFAAGGSNLHDEDEAQFDFEFEDEFEDDDEEDNQHNNAVSESSLQQTPPIFVHSLTRTSSSSPITPSLFKKRKIPRPIYFADTCLVDREVTVVHINIIQFHQYARRKHPTTISEDYRMFTTFLRKETARFGGILETFFGDKVWISFNASSKCTHHAIAGCYFAFHVTNLINQLALSHLERLVAAAGGGNGKNSQNAAAAAAANSPATIPSPANNNINHENDDASSLNQPEGDPRFGLCRYGANCGVATGKAFTGPLGNSAIKRHNIISFAVSEAAALERQGIRYAGCNAIISGDMIPAIEQYCQYVLIDATLLPGSNGKRRRIACLKGPMLGPAADPRIVRRWLVKVPPSLATATSPSPSSFGLGLSLNNNNNNSSQQQQPQQCSAFLVANGSGGGAPANLPSASSLATQAQQHQPLANSLNTPAAGHHNATTFYKYDVNMTDLSTFALSSEINSVEEEGVAVINIPNIAIRTPRDAANNHNNNHDDNNNKGDNDHHNDDNYKKEEEEEEEKSVTEGSSATPGLTAPHPHDGAMVGFHTNNNNNTLNWSSKTQTPSATPPPSTMAVMTTTGRSNLEAYYASLPTVPSVNRYRTINDCFNAFLEGQPEVAKRLLVEALAEATAEEKAAPANSPEGFKERKAVVTFIATLVGSFLQRGVDGRSYSSVLGNVHMPFNRSLSHVATVCVKH